MSTVQSYYDVLGVTREATPDEIKRAYRRLALLHHPDKNVGNAQAAAERFKLVSEAYQVLENRETRIQYDADGCTVSVAFQSPEEIFRNFFETLAESGFFCVDEDLLGEFFEGPEVGVALQTLSHMPNTGILLTSLQTYARGTTMEPVVSKLSDALGGGAPKRRGIVRRSPDIAVEVSVDLEEVFLRKLKKVTLRRIRRGDNGTYAQDERAFIIPLYDQTVVYKGQADELAEYDEPGDVVFSVSVRPHPLFKRRPMSSRDSHAQCSLGYDLLVVKRVSLFEIYNGCTFYVRHLNGEMLKFSTKRAILGQRWQRVRGEGLPVSRKSTDRGDLIVKFVLDADMSEQQMAGLKELFPPVTGEEGILQHHDGACPEVVLEPCDN